VETLKIMLLIIIILSIVMSVSGSHQLQFIMIPIKKMSEAANKLTVNNLGSERLDIEGTKNELKDLAAEWFHSKWGVPKEAYLECMNAYLNKETELGWYLCLAGDKIVAGLGVIENDFHDRKDLTPNVCAVYTEEEHRCKGIAGKLLNMVVDDMKKKEIEPLYLVTDHTSFYERYGWEFICMVQGDGEPDMTRMYIHR
jgi:GNAT superfamily N-acetyltransferase